MVASQIHPLRVRDRSLCGWGGTSGSRANTLILMVRKSRPEDAEKQHTLSPNLASGKKMSSPPPKKGPLWESWGQGPRGPRTCILAVGANQAGAAPAGTWQGQGPWFLCSWMTTC